MSLILYIAAALLVGVTAGDNSTAPDTCGPGLWGAALEDWVTAERVTVGRHGRIMSLAPSQGYYVSDRMDLTPPPPPQYYHNPHHNMQHRGPYPAAPGPEPPARPQGPPRGAPPPSPQLQGSGSMPYDEWQATPPPPPGAGKIVNRPPNPYKDQFKPSYPPPSPPHQIPVSSDRVDESPRPPPQKQVSETDLYLLGAIEKLVYRVDLMEKRLRKMEENVHYLVVGVEAKPEPCMSNFTRIGGGCYHISAEALNWKNANYACRKLKGHLLELAGDQRRTFTSGLLADTNLKGFDYWTGGLNPGLLWIWSHSASAVANTTDAATIVGEGRCLALVHDAAAAGYVYRGQDCALRHRYVCQRAEDNTNLGNEIERVARLMRHKRVPRVNWDDLLR